MLGRVDNFHNHRKCPRRIWQTGDWLGKHKEWNEVISHEVPVSPWTPGQRAPQCPGGPTVLFLWNMSCMTAMTVQSPWQWRQQCPNNMILKQMIFFVPSVHVKNISLVRVTSLASRSRDWLYFAFPSRLDNTGIGVTHHMWPDHRSMHQTTPTC